MSLLMMSVSGGAMVVVVMLLRCLAVNRLPKRTFLALWAVVLLRLLIPFSIPSPFCAYAMLPEYDAVLGIRIAQSPPVITPGFPSDSSPIVPGGASVSWVMVVWAVGLLSCASFFIVCYLRGCKEFGRSQPVTTGAPTDWLAAHKLMRPVVVRQSDRIAAPLTYGVLRPVILLPSNTDWGDAVCLHYTLTHELAHIKRFDAATKLLLAAVLSVHWFNPCVWALYILANRDIELCCDEDVVRICGEPARSAYALMLIGMEETKSRFAPLCSHFSKAVAYERIEAIMRFQRYTVAKIVLATFLVIGVVAGFATSAPPVLPTAVTSAPAPRPLDYACRAPFIEDETMNEEHKNDTLRDTYGHPKDELASSFYREYTFENGACVQCKTTIFYVDEATAIQRMENAKVREAEMAPPGSRSETFDWTQQGNVVTYCSKGTISLKASPSFVYDLLSGKDNAHTAMEWR